MKKENKTKLETFLKWEQFSLKKNIDNKSRENKEVDNYRYSLLRLKTFQIGNKAITLISLVITIIVLIILSSVGIYLSLGNKGIFNKAKQAKEASDKQTATEIINLKITTAQMNKYIEKQEMPTLKELSISLRDDSEIAYVTEKSQIASAKYEIGENPKSIYTKLNKYPYEFEINDSLQLASINGDKLLTSNNNIVPKICIEQYEVVILSGCGGEGYNIIDNLNNYNTLTVGSRTCNQIAGSTYWNILGYYEDNEGNIKTENILNTTSPSNTTETFNIEKYNKIRFGVVCTSAGSGLNWCYYYFNNIQIF